MDARFYNTEEIDIERLANELENFYRMQGYQVQQIGNKDQMMVQLKKGGDLAAIVGLQAALSVIIQRMAGGTIAMIGQQKWIDKAAVGAVGLVAAPVLWPLMLTAGAGAIRQASLANQVLNVVDGLVHQQRPDVRIGPIPVHLLPQIQQQWAPAPQYVPPTPVYRPAAPVYTPPAPSPAPVAPVTKLRCPSCNTLYEEGDTFCSGCGRSLKTLCPNCKAEVKPGVAFCPRCGASIPQARSGAQVIAPTQPAAPTVPKYQPPAPPQATIPAQQPQPQPYVPPVPQEPPVVPQPSVTLIPSAPKPGAPPAPSQQPQPSTPKYTPPAQTQQPPTMQAGASAASQTIPAQKPIMAKPSSEPAVDPNAPWGKLIFSDGKEVQLAGERVLIGRYDHDVPGINPEVDLSDVPGGDTTSRIHATIEHIGSTYMLTDLNSTNATRINGKRLEPDKPEPINDGDTLHFGKVTCTFKKV